MIQDDIISAARECLGTPFLHQGREPGVGLDCVGLVRYPVFKLGLFSEDFTEYDREPNPVLMGRLLHQYLERIPAPEVGCIIWFRVVNLPQHLALYTGDNLIHAINFGPKKVVEHGYKHPWPGRAVAFFRYKL